MDVAEQLSLESQLYHQITPQECIRYAKIQTDKEVEYLNTFCSTHDKIAAWVTTTILDCKVLERRSDIQYKVAEVCVAYRPELG